MKSFRFFKFVLLLDIVVLALFFLKDYFGINLSGSIPYGLYFKTYQIPERNTYLAFTLPPKLFNYASSRGYLFVHQVFKKVIALPFDTVQVLDNKILVNGITYLTPVAKFDSHGRTLQKYPDGTYQGNCYWVLGDAINSWDSRYYGCIPSKFMISTLKPVFTFG